MSGHRRAVAVISTNARIILAGSLIGLPGALVMAATASAQPSPPPWIPGAPQANPGSYSFPYSIIAVPAPATTDARGIRAAATADPGAEASGIPGSQLGLSPNKPNALTSSSTRYRIGAGSNPSPSLPTVNPGTNIGAGMEVPTLEDPGGAAPKTAPSAESSQSTIVPPIPGQPAPILEAPGGQSVQVSTTAAAPPAVAGTSPAQVPAAPPDS